MVSAIEVRARLGLDRVLLVVAGSPWQKVGTRVLTPARDRLAVVEAAVESVDGVEASALEVERDGPTYTADTLAALRTSDPEAELFLIVGADVAAELDTWARVEEVRDGATLVVAGRFDPGTRPGALAGELRRDGWRVEEVQVPHLEVSSTDLRSRLSSGRPVDFLIPSSAIREIKKRGLYPAGR
jgi:nicotinate-nucleotide adenylyltransferase